MTDLVTGPAGFLGSQLTASITVHGNDVHGDADEDTPMRREPNPYSQSKVDGELLLRRMIEDENAPVTIVRPGWINDEPVTQCEFLGAIATELGAAPPARRAPYRAGLLAGVVAETAWKLAGREQAPPVTRYGLRLLGGENRFSVARARRELGFSPAIGYAEGVRRGIAWYREARAGTVVMT